MASRIDVNVDYNISPRVISVDAPSTEIIIQDIVDTLRDSEEAFAQGLSFDKLLNASGKDDLGGGVLVGLTGSLQNALLAFEGRTTPASIGQVDTVTAPPIGYAGFTDASATFISDNVQRGSLLINFTDKSVADIHQVVSETELVTKDLVNGTLNEFTIGDDYYVFNIIQVKVQGGNLVAVDEDGVALSSPILPTAFTQVLLTSSSSATLQEQLDIEYSSFNGGVTVRIGSVYDGVDFPVGTPRAPVNNIEDAVAIATARGFTKIYLKSNITFGAGDQLAGFDIVGESETRTTITIEAAADVTDCTYSHAKITGVLDGSSSILNCELGALTVVKGIVRDSILNSDVIQLGGGAVAEFINCVSGVPGLGTPIIDMGGSGQSLAVRNYNGGMTISNKNGPEAVSIDMASGQLIIDDTVTAGNIVMRGIASWSNRETYAGGAVIVNELIDGNLIQALDVTVYDTKVRVNVLTGISGTLFPIGTSKAPSNNMTDALAIANKLNITQFFIETSTTLPEDDFSDKQFEGVSAASTMLTIPTLATVDDVTFTNLILAGDMGGSVRIERCNIISLLSFSGWMLNVALGASAVVELAGNTTSYILDSWSAATGASYPTIDFGGTGNGFAMRNYSGGIIFTNKTGPEEASISMVGGEIIIENTVTNGLITLRGTGTWANEATYAGGATVNNELVDGVFIQDLSRAAYENAVHVDVDSSNVGTAYPCGTPLAPVNNIADAVAIAAERGFSEIHLLSDITLTTGDSLAEFTISGQSESQTTITIEAGADVTDCTYKTATVTGVLDGKSTITNCNIGTLTVVSGVIRECVLSSATITLGGTNATQFIDCVSGVPGLGTAIIDMGGTGQSLAIRNYNGGIEIRNKTGTDAVSIDMGSGQLIIDDTVTTGTIVMRGIATWTNRETYAGGANIVNQLIDGNLIQALDVSVFDKQVAVNATVGVAGTLFPTGTQKQPVSNLTDALSIANNLTIHTLYLETSNVVPLAQDFSNIRFTGISAATTVLSIPPGAQVDTTTYNELILTGYFSGQATVERCQILDLFGFNGAMVNVGLFPGYTVTLGGGLPTYILDSWSATTSTVFPIIDMGGTGQSLTMRNISGGIKLINKTGTDEVSISLVGGSIIIDDTVTGGVITLRGTGTWVNEYDYVGGATVINELVDGQLIQGLNRTIYEDAVHVDTGSSNTGTEFPIGTPDFPVNNTADAIAIAAANGFTKLNVLSDVTFTIGQDISGLNICSTGAMSSTVTINTGVISTNTSFCELSLQGTVNGYHTVVSDSIILDLAGFHGVMFNCGIQSTLTLASGNTDFNRFIDCYGAQKTLISPRPVIDMGGDGLAMCHAFKGVIDVGNMTSPTSVMLLGLLSGATGLLNTITLGAVYVTGIGGVVFNNIDPSVIFNSAGLVNNEAVAAAVWDELLDEHLGIGSTGEALKNTGTNSTTTETKVDEIHKLHGLDAANPLVVSSTERSAGVDIVQDVTEDGLGTVTVTRQ